MTHLYSRSAECALQSLQVMATDSERTWVVSEICQKAGLPEQFTRKVLPSLVKAGILSSTRGPGGGFVFARDPAEITLEDVIDAIDGHMRFDLCILGFANCSEKSPCALHEFWSPIKTSALQMLRDHTVAEMGEVPIRRRGRRHPRRGPHAGSRRW